MALAKVLVCIIKRDGLPFLRLFSNINKYVEVASAGDESLTCRQSRVATVQLGAIGHLIGVQISRQPLLHVLFTGCNFKSGSMLSKLPAVPEEKG